MSAITKNQLVVSKAGPLKGQYVLLITDDERGWLSGVFLNHSLDEKPQPDISAEEVIKNLISNGAVSSLDDITYPVRNGYCFENGDNHFRNRAASGKIPTLITPITTCASSFQIHSKFAIMDSPQSNESKKILIVGQMEFSADELESFIAQGHWHQPIPATRKLLCETPPCQLWSKANQMVHVIG